MALLGDMTDMEESDLLDFLLDDTFSSGNKPNASEWNSLEREILSDSTVEDFLSELLAGPLCEDTGSHLSSSPPASDSGISEDQAAYPSPGTWDSSPPHSPNFVQSDHNYSLLLECEVVTPESASYALQSVRSETCEGDVLIDLDNYVDVSEPELEAPIDLLMEDEEDDDLICQTEQDLRLTEEESRLLRKDGVSLPQHLPLTKAEERALKRVRRKIRNKRSAQESRRKKKEYVDGLENRVTVCTAHNQQLQKKVQQLQKDNMTLLQQLRNLQNLLRQTGTKTTAASTCVMVLALSFCLILFPNLYPFGARVGHPDLRGVLSRQLRELRSDPAPVSHPSPGALHSVDVAVQDKPLQVSGLEKVFLDLSLQELHLEPALQGAQNDTPEVQDLGTAESSLTNSNSSSDLPGEGHHGAGGESRATPAPSESPPQAPHVLPEKQDWLERTHSVFITQHRSDEM